MTARATRSGRASAPVRVVRGRFGSWRGRATPAGARRRGAWIAFLDADDLWFPETRRRGRSFHRRAGVTGFFSDGAFPRLDGQLRVWFGLCTRTSSDRGAALRSPGS